jgi:hypothetical protein
MNFLRNIILGPTYMGRENLGSSNILGRNNVDPSRDRLRRRSQSEWLKCRVLCFANNMVDLLFRQVAKLFSFAFLYTNDLSALVTLRSAVALTRSVLICPRTMSVGRTFILKAQCPP